MVSAMQLDAPVEPARKKLKTSDLPLSSATRSAVESLAHTFKKKGGYDALRKQVWDKFEATDSETQFTKSILEVAERELEEHTETLLSLERSKGALLIEGAVERTGIYQAAEEQIDKLIQTHIATIEQGIRDIRKADVGEDQAAAEELRGSKTDEQYAEDTANRRHERDRVREEIAAKEREIAEQKKKIERAKRREEEKLREAEEEKRRVEREARRKAEREADAEREKKPKLSKEEVERLEQEALEELLNEGKRKTHRSRHQLEPEIDETLAPPPRKAMPASAIKPISRDPPTKLSEKKDSIKTKIEDENVKKATSSTPHEDDHKDDDRPRRRSRDYSRDRDDRRRRDSRERGLPRDKDSDSRRDRDDRRHRSRDRDQRRRRDSRDRDDRHGGRERSRSRSRDRDRRRRSRSPDRDRDRTRRRTRSPAREWKSAEELKQEAVKKRELEAKAYLAAQKEAREKGLPIPGLHDRPRHNTGDGFIKPQWGGHREDPLTSRKRDGDTTSVTSPLKERARDVSRTSSHRETRDRSTSPVNIDRYVPGSSTRRRSEVERSELSARSPARKRSRSRDRDRDRDRTRDRDRERDKDRDYRRRDDHRESDRSHRSSRHDDDRDEPKSSRKRSRSRSRSRSRRRERSRSRDRDRRHRSRTRSRSRSRSPAKKKESSRRDRSRSRSRDRRDSRRHRSRSRDRDRDRDRNRDKERRGSEASLPDRSHRSRSRDSKRVSSRKDY